MKKIKLFPRKAKYYGIALILMSWVPPFLAYKLSWLPKNEGIGFSILSGIILLGCLLIIMSKEKIEDEFVDSCRLIAFRASFIMGIGVYITTAFIFGEAKESFSLLLGQIFFYLFTFYSLKSGLIKHDK